MQFTNDVRKSVCNKDINFFFFPFSIHSTYANASSKEWKASGVRVILRASAVSAERTLGWECWKCREIAKYLCVLGRWVGVVGAIEAVAVRAVQLAGKVVEASAVDALDLARLVVRLCKQTLAVVAK